VQCERPKPSRLLLALIPLALAACSVTGDRLGDDQVRPGDRPECQVGSQRQDLAAGVPSLMGGTGCRADPGRTRP